MKKYLIVTCLACPALTAGSFFRANLLAQPATRPATLPSTGAGASVDRFSPVIRFLEERVRRDPDDILAQNRLAGEYLERFRRSGDDKDLYLAKKAADQSLQAVPADLNSGGLYARARVSMAFHHFAAARDDAMKLVAAQPDKRPPLQILGDAQLELGDYEKAAETYKKMEALGDPEVETEARLARLAQVRGEIDEARKRIASAVQIAETLSPVRPDVVAWCHVRAGYLAFSTGDWASAEKHYEAALASNPSDWPAMDHLAELRTAQKRYDESIKLYEQLVQRVRPELYQSLGDVLNASGKTDLAKPWHTKAREAYLKAVGDGSPHYYHHLAGFFCDSEPNPEEAIKWARKDLEVRQTAQSYDGLAWALYQAGQSKPAAAAMEQALALGTKDAHVLYHATLIYARAGDTAKARDCLKRAATANPKFNEFHVHR